MDESSILGGGQQLVDPPQTRIPSWLVWTIRKSGVSPKIRPKIRFSGIETRFAVKPSNWKGRRKDIFLFFALPRFSFQGETRIRHARVFQIVNLVKSFYSRQISRRSLNSRVAKTYLECKIRLGVKLC